MRLASFISDNLEPILQAWEDFARTIETPEAAMDARGLRDHAALMLQTIIIDLDQPQTMGEQTRKSKGLAPRGKADTYAEIHAAARLASGYTINQLVSEYRALRASVLKLWARASPTVRLTDPDDMTRFNEAIDEALAESVARYCDIVGEAAVGSQRRLEAILEAVPVGIALADAQGNVTLTNAEHAKIWGKQPPPSSISDYQQWKGWWADSSERHGKPVAPLEWPLVSALHGGGPAHSVLEIEPYSAPGVRRTVLIHSTAVQDAAGAVVGAVVAEMDITGQIETESALNESEAKFETIANAMPQMVWSTRADGRHDYFNQQWYDFTGKAAGSTDGALWSAMFHPDDQARARAAWSASVATGERYEMQYRLLHHSGLYRWVLGRALPVRNSAGAIVRWMGTCTDIHSHKLAEQGLKDENARKDEFLAMLAHELRNPLAPISSAAQILRLVGHDAALVAQSGAVIERQVKHMTNLVDDLLDVSRVTRGLVTLANEELDLKLLLASAVEQVRPLIDARQHVLVLQVAPAPAMVLGDRTRLVQVIANLLNNAAKYTPIGGNIVASIGVAGAKAALAVRDDGAGIDAALLPHIFDLFTQGERTPDRVQGGLGLGLALVKSLTALHGGTVSASSAGAGRGSTFTLSLPVLAREASPDRHASAPPAVAAPPRPLSVMVVDDNIDAAQALATVLALSGHRMTVHDHALAVLADPGRGGVDVFILDIGLPGMNGHDLARRLRQSPATAQAVLVALTGYGQSSDRALSEAAGFDHHLVKPLSHAELDVILREVPALRPG
jgi:PAS domain S-box-containing protein